MLFKLLLDFFSQSCQLCISILCFRLCPATLIVMFFFFIFMLLGTNFLKLLKMLQLLLLAIQKLLKTLSIGICIPSLVCGDDGVKVMQCLCSQSAHLIFFQLRTHPAAVEPLLQLLKVSISDHFTLHLLF